MNKPGNTNWSVIEGTASSDAEARRRFALLYSPALAACFGDQWRSSPYVESVEDAVQEVFVECYKHNGALLRVDRQMAGGFRAYFYGVARNVEERCREVMHLLG